jgi:polysaccharide deacetylase family protein (PEP-CTERM system associated)
MPVLATDETTDLPNRTMPQQTFTNAMTIDVEDYFHVSGFADQVSRSDWDAMPSRVVANTHRLLALLERHQTIGTFFVLGWVADRFPQLVRDIHRGGHEVGCHSYWHRLVYDLSPDEFRQDLVKARDVLQNLIGEPVTNYRAPSFSITRRSLWALEVLAEEGFTSDSSIYPVYHDRYGMPEADSVPHRVISAAGTIDEFPGGVISFGKLQLAVSGGGYFRLYPRRFTEFCLARINARTGSPFMFYIHPWEVDPDQPRLAGSLMSRFRHYQNLRTTEHKLNWLLPRFRFDSMGASIRSIEGELSEHSLSDGLYGVNELSFERPERVAELQLQNS